MRKKNLFILFALLLSLILWLPTVNGINCDPNCSRCNYKTGECEQCDWNNGWFLKEPERTQCVKCSLDGEIFRSVYCFNCISNCKVCNNLKTCLLCMPGYYKSCDGKCRPCNINNCDVCEADLNFCSSGDSSDCALAPQPVCKKCLNNFFLKNKGTECSACTAEGEFKECKITYKAIFL